MENRNYSLDLLRIITMIMIVTSHVLFLSGTLNNTIVFSSEYYVTQFLSALAYCFTNCFALISGYYLCNRRFSFKRVVKIYSVVMFYSVLLTIVLIFAGKLDFSLNTIVATLLPVSTTQYWYITAYFGLCLIFPFINLLLQHIEDKVLGYLILVLSFLFVLNPASLVGFEDPFYINNGYNWLWFVYLFIIASFIRRKNFIINRRKATAIFVLCLFTIAGSRYITALLTNRLFGKIIGSGFMYRYNSIPVLIATISLFIIFLDSNMNRFKKIIEYTSPLMLGVYLIHMHFGVKEQLRILLSTKFVYEGALIYVDIVCAVFAIFLLCCLVEKMRQIVFDKLGLDNFLVQIGTKLDNIIISIGSENL